MHFVIICVSLLKILPSSANVVNYYSHPNEHQLSKNYFLHTFRVLEKEWSISFEVNPSWYEEGTRNFLHLVFFSNGERHTALKIGIESSTCSSWQTGCLNGLQAMPFYEYLFNAQNLNTSTYKIWYYAPPLDQWTKIEVSQKPSENQWDRSYKLHFTPGTITRVRNTHFINGNIGNYEI